MISRILALSAIALVSTVVSACGGGGGGGSSTPPVGGPPPGGPPPTSGPTATPMPTSTPAPTPAPTATPAPPGAQSITMLPDTTGRFGLVQIFDWDGTASHAPLTASQIESEAPHEDTVWGAFNPSAWNSGHPGMIVSRYMLPVEDDNSVSGHDLTWWQNNHPNWILYACDGSGNPTKDLAWSTSYFPDVPLDFSNPSVIQYQMSEMIPYLKTNGYNTLAVDNTDLLNYLEGGNPNFGQHIVSGEYGCGTYDSSGTFHRAFGGPLDAQDPAFISAMITWVKTVQSDLHSAGMKLIVNHPLYSPPTSTNESQLLAATDAMVYERGFTDYGKYMGEAANLVSNAVTWAQYTQSHHIAILITDYLCSGWNGTQAFNNNASCPSDPSQIPAPQVDWSLATYALVNLGGADVYISPQTGQRMSYRPEYSTGYGSPCGSYSKVTSTVYERKFQGALVVINAGSGSYSFALPSGHTYHDIESRLVSNPLLLGPADGYVLLTSNGCS